MDRLRGKTLWFIPAALAVLMGAVALYWILGGRAKPLPGNLLVITLDTTRADSLGAYGAKEVRTPNLDRLAREGVMFKNCQTPVPLTLPAHCSLFTGRTPLGHQVRNNGRYALPPEETTLAERLKAAGFRSYAVVASYVLLGRFGLKQGFDVYDDSLDSYKIMNSYNTEIPADVVSSRFVKWLSGRREGRFFAWVHFYDPHDPYLPPPEYRHGLRENDPWRLYLGEVEFMDHHVGRVLEALDTMGLRSDTLVVAVGDHGEAFGEHGEKGHAIFCYEQNVKVPLIFSHPLLPRGLTVEDRADLTDIVPTLLELYGLERGEGLQGRSLARQLRGRTKPSPPRALYLESFYGFEELGWAPLTGVVDGAFKYLSLPRPELYDLRADPRERRNLAGSRPEVVRRLKELLASYVSEHTELRAETGRKLTAEDIRQLESLGYISASAGSVRPGGTIDPKEGIVLDGRLKDFFKALENAPSKNIEGEIEHFLGENGLVKSPAIYARLWRLYEKRNERQKVVQTLEEARAAFPEEVGSRMQLAQLYAVMKNHGRVLALGREILEKDPVNSVAHILMADAHAALDDQEAAQASLESALAIEPENVSLLIKYAELLTARGKISEAIRVYDGLTSRDDILGDADFLFKLALFYSKSGDDRRAAELMERSCRGKPSGKCRFYLAVIQVRLGEFEAAGENMRICLESHAGELSPEERSQAEKFLRSLENNRPSRV